MLQKMLEKVKLGEVSINDLARNTPGYVPADLKSLISEAGLLAV